METFPNLAIYPPPPKRIRPGARIIPVPLLVAWLLSVPIAAVGEWVAGHYWEDPVPPDGSPPAASQFGWWLVPVAFFVFAGCGIATAVRLGEARRRARPLKRALVVAFCGALLLFLVAAMAPLEENVAWALTLIPGPICLVLAGEIMLAEARAQLTQTLTLAGSACLAALVSASAMRHDSAAGRSARRATRLTSPGSTLGSRWRTGWRAG